MILFALFLFCLFLLGHDALEVKVIPDECDETKTILINISREPYFYKANQFYFLCFKKQCVNPFPCGYDSMSDASVKGIIICVDIFSQRMKWKVMVRND